MTSFILSFIDSPLPILRDAVSLIAAKPKGCAPNMWVYVNVFGLYQWVIFLALLILMVMGLALFNALSEHETVLAFGTKRGANKDYELNSAHAGFAVVFLFAIQMGSHTNSKQLATRLLTLTASYMTFMLFAYYTTDITADMTSGPPGIPIRTFEDVIQHEYKVITTDFGYYRDLLASAKTGTAKQEVYKHHFATRRTLTGVEAQWTESMKEVIGDPKTLYYGSTETLIPPYPGRKVLTGTLKLVT